MDIPCVCVSSCPIQCMRVCVPSCVSTFVVSDCVLRCLMMRVCVCQRACVGTYAHAWVLCVRLKSYVSYATRWIKCLSVSCTERSCMRACVCACVRARVCASVCVLLLHEWPGLTPFPASCPRRPTPRPKRRPNNGSLFPFFSPRRSDFSFPPRPARAAGC